MVKSTVPTYKFHKIRINTQLLGGIFQSCLYHLIGKILYRWVLSFRGDFKTNLQCLILYLGSLLAKEDCYRDLKLAEVEEENIQFEKLNDTAPPAHRLPTVSLDLNFSS